MLTWRWLTNNTTAKIVSLLLAVLLWFLVTMQKEAEKSIRVPVRLTHLQHGLHIVGEVPQSVNLVVYGPRMLLLKVHEQDLRMCLDMAHTGEGTVTFTNLDKYLDLPPGLSVKRVFPGKIEVRLVAGG